MKLTLPAFLAALCLAASPAIAAGPDRPGQPNISAQKSAMASLSWMVGDWEGQGWTLSPTGERLTFRQTEAVETRLDGALLLIEGRGYAPAAEPGAPERLMFNAFAVVSFNDATRAYTFRSYAMGYANSFEAEVRDDGAFVWRIAPPGAPRMRYIITQPSLGVWCEIGERSTDNGETWTQFFEMRLTKKL
jgi:hypothetical protein